MLKNWFEVVHMLAIIESVELLIVFLVETGKASGHCFLTALSLQSAAYLQQSPGVLTFRVFFSI